jgi:hypothetical protein
MEYIDEARGVLRNAEQSLVDVAQKALSQHDYPKATFLMGLAEELRDIVGRLESPPGDTLLPPDMEGAKISQDLAQAVQGAVKPKHSRGSPKKGEFPKFLRDDDSLYKIGWSKTGRAPYEHKAPKYVLLALVDKLKAVAAKKRRFTMEHILPLKKKDDQAELPSYQVYVCIAWLRQLGLVTQYGRKGYSISHPPKLEFSVEKSWQKLPSIETAQV